jgi:Na+/phosphate symporter
MPSLRTFMPKRKIPRLPKIIKNVMTLFYFINAKILILVESIGVIMGANLGTTQTAWIIAIVGKFSLAKVALPIIGIGTPFIFIGKGKWNAWVRF